MKSNSVFDAMRQIERIDACVRWQESIIEEHEDDFVSAPALMAKDTIKLLNAYRNTLLDAKIDERICLNDE